MQPVKTRCRLGNLDIRFTTIDQLPPSVASKAAPRPGMGLVEVTATHKQQTVGAAYFSVGPYTAYLLHFDVAKEALDQRVDAALLRAAQKRLPEILPSPSLDPSTEPLLRELGIR